MAITENKNASRLIKGREMNFLLRELAVWQESFLITPEQARQIQAFYTVKRHSFVRILLAAGIVLVVLGAVSLIAANWPDIPRPIRFAALLTGYIACIIMAWVFDEKYKNSRAAHAFLLLAAFIYGAGIFLSAQMYYDTYDFSRDWSVLVGWWIAGLFPMVFLSGDILQLSLTQILSLLYLLGTDILNDLFAEGLAPVSALLPPFHVLALVVALWIAWALIQGYTPFVINILLTLLILASRLRLCFSVSTTFIILSMLGLVLTLPVTASFSYHNALQTISLLLMGLCGLPLTYPDIWEGSALAELLRIPQGAQSMVLPIVSTVILGLALLWRLHCGRVMGGLLFALLLCRWFFDDLLSFMSRAAGFTSIGVALLLVGLVLEWRKRKS